MENSRASSADWPSIHAYTGRFRVEWKFIDAQECPVRGIKIEVGDQVDELKLPNDTMVNTEGRVQLVSKCGWYRGEISARVFPNMSKSMILGTPCLSKENSHIDWAQAVVVVNQDH